MSTENFYFDSFEGDYYLSKDAEGVSHLKVSQKMTTVFPDFKQNKGICLELPATNQDGKNITLPSLGRSDITVLRNGESEPIYSIEKYEGYYEVCTGTEEYVLGTQEYTFEYEYEKVVTDFESFQELYWDTNGNGWTQKFNNVTARVHLADDVQANFTGNSWCYVGKYGAKGTDRCEVTKISDGMQFTTKDLTSYENLTFDMEFLPGSFVVPEPPVNYGLLWILLIIVVVCGLLLISPIKKLIKAWPKRKFYKNYFVKPEYQPDSRYSLAEMTEVYLGSKKDVKVGMLLDLVVQKKVQMVKNEKGKWSVQVLTIDGLRPEEENLLGILNGGKDLVVNKVIEIRARTATTTLVSLSNSLKNRIVSDLRKDGLVEAKYKFAGAGNSMVSEILATAIASAVIGLPLGVMAVMLLAECFGVFDAVGVVFLQDEFVGIAFGVVMVTIIIGAILVAVRAKYDTHTEAGLVASKYMEGLKMYISMAETERLKFLQSVDGADVSPDGVVKLYEKLLPYAAVFGLEKSWMNALAQYCQVQEIAQPDYISMIGAAEMSRLMRESALYANRSSVIHEGGSGISGGGGFSSSSSGGGGGGFSGGGGGGGGGHGR